MRQANVIRYVTPLREGGSLPAIVDSDDGFQYVLKFRGAGQGVKALIAEIIGGEMARALGLKVPEIVFLWLDDVFSKTEPDEEIQDLLRESTGLNLGLHYLSGAITFDPVLNKPDAKTASLIVWLDMVLMNVDRTARNTNMLMWNKELWLIDHGAALYFHHAWQSWKTQSVRMFDQIKDHVLLPFATELGEAGKFARGILTEELLNKIVALIPEEWLHDESGETLPQERRNIYVQFLLSRITMSETWEKEAGNARATVV